MSIKWVYLPPSIPLNILRQCLLLFFQFRKVYRLSSTFFDRWNSSPVTSFSRPCCNRNKIFYYFFF